MSDINDFDRCDQAMDELFREFRSAVDKFPKFASPHEGYAIIKEEFDELWYEIMNNKQSGSHERMHKEAKQVAAMALRFMIDIPLETPEVPE